MPEYKNQHFVPRVYLKNFIDGYPENKKMLWCLDKSTKTIKHQSLTITCSRKYCYSYLSEDGAWNHEKEIYLNQIENEYNSFFERICQTVDNIISGNNISTLDSADFDHLYSFLLMQMIRVPTFFDSLKTHLEKKFTELNHEYSNPEPNTKVTSDVKKSIFSNFIDIEGEYFRKLQTIFRTKGIVLSIIPKEIDANFITSDSPILVTNPKSQNALVHPSTEISLPISNKIAISLLGSSELLKYRIFDDIGEIKNINESLAKNGDKIVLSGRREELDRLNFKELTLPSP
jgi:hypothetical protein